MALLLAPGPDIHEAGWVRMGHDSNTPLLNKQNQWHARPKVFVTGGASMTPTFTQNPSLTFRTRTARAAGYAVDKMKKQQL